MKTKHPKQFRIYTLGCKVNQYDSQLIREQLVREGYVESPGDSFPNRSGDVIVVNTCTVTGKTDQKCRNAIRRFARDKQDATLIVTGCYADGDREVLEKISGVDIVAGNELKSSFMKLLGSPSDDIAEDRITAFEGRTRAFLKIQDGCNEFCSYCIVPYVRGRPRSKKIRSVADEVKGILDSGYKEIVVTGIHLGSYGCDLDSGERLDDAIKAIATAEGKFRIRVSSLEPMNIDIPLIKRLSKIEKLCPHFHIPLQSGDDTVLKFMNRKYDFASYKKIAEAFKENFPDCALTTDIIVGFPGETDEMFLNSVKAVKEIGFCKVHIFPYSERKGTKACELKGKACPSVVKERIKQLETAAKETASQYKHGLIGKTKEVLIEEKTKTGKLTGFTDNYQRVVFDGDEACVNEYVNLELSELQEENFVGKSSPSP